MKNLRKLFCVACAVFFFTSCEETYNDKLFGREKSARNMARTSSRIHWI